MRVEHAKFRACPRAEHARQDSNLRYLLDFRTGRTYYGIVASVVKPEADRGLTQDQRDSLRRLAKAHGGSNVRIFGSRARGEAGPASDVDLLVDMAAECSLLDLIAIKHDVEDELGVEVDVVTEAGLSRHLKDQVLREAVPV